MTQPYLAVTGTVFALLTIAHLWRIATESRALATDPWFAAITIVSAALSLWAFRLLLHKRRTGSK